MHLLQKRLRIKATSCFLLLQQGGNRHQWRIRGGACAPSPFFGFFFTKQSLLAKISIKQVRNLSENARNGHFRDSNFQEFLGGTPPDPPRKFILRHSLVPPF